MIGTAKKRFEYIDQFRGFVGVLMLLGHSSYYLNSVWKNLDPLDPLFPSWGQFVLRYAGYLCAPGFLIMAGAMVWWSFQKRVEKGISIKIARWHLIQRAIFLIVIQMTWVNASWSGFQYFRPWHFGIISSIGFSVLLLSIIVHLRWEIRLFIGVSILLIHPLLLTIPYNSDSYLSSFLMKMFVEAGAFNKYPVLPWFALSILGSVMASGWLQVWHTNKQKVLMSFGIGLGVLILAIIVRITRGYGNLFPFSDFSSYSFFIDQKYPPSLFMNLWFFGMVVIGVGSFILLNKFSPKIMMLFSIPGKVPLFFYGVHLAILGVFVKRFDFFYREGSIFASFVGFFIMLLIMFPLSQWFYGVKRKSTNFFIRMI